MGKVERGARKAGTARGAASAVLVAAVLWGLSGTASQYLMQDGGLSLAWLATARMATAGVLLLALAAVRHGRAALLGPWRSAPDALRLTAFAIVGLFLVQYSYLAAIDAANAAAAAVIQYLGSGLVVLWSALAARRLPRAGQAAALLVALAGIALLATNGSPGRLALPSAALAWGLVSAVTLAAYTILPQPLLRRHPMLAVVGWAMLIAALAAAVVLRPTPLPPAALGTRNLLLFAFVAVLGTVLPFSLYLGSLRRLPPSEAALLANSEPVAAAVAAFFWLGVRLGPWAILGAVLVLGATTALYLGAGAPAPTAGGVPGANGAQSARER